MLDNIIEFVKVMASAAADPANAIAPDEIVKQRRKICEACPSAKRNGRRCLVCTCSIYNKTLFSASACPLEHWGTHENK